MGTSKSGTGPGPGVPLVPPWVPDPAPPAPPPGDDGSDNSGNNDSGDQDEQAQPDSVPPASAPAPQAPHARFGGARANLGNFARTGSPDDMRRGLGHYVHRGYGGARYAAQRMGGTARTAGTLYGALSSAAAGQAAGPGSPFDPALLAGRSADEVMDALVEAVRPVDGTQDAEAGRGAIRDALSELLNRFPDADLLSLSEEQRLFAIERYLALDVYGRFALDLGKTVQEKAPSATAALSRLKEIKDYIKETVSAQFRELKKSGESPGARRVSEMANQALRDTFAVFEGYAQ
ncbi:MAG: hypothetical protein H6843_14020 [Rhodospirillaceae bacterium]|nr:hypothetical protein [Rhodospirillaceae bacterium]